MELLPVVRVRRCCYTNDPAQPDLPCYIVLVLLFVYMNLFNVVTALTFVDVQVTGRCVAIVPHCCLLFRHLLTCYDSDILLGY